MAANHLAMGMVVLPAMSDSASARIAEPEAEVLERSQPTGLSPPWKKMATDKGSELKNEGNESRFVYAFGGPR